MFDAVLRASSMCDGRCYALPPLERDMVLPESLRFMSASFAARPAVVVVVVVLSSHRPLSRVLGFQEVPPMEEEEEPTQEEKEKAYSEVGCYADSRRDRVLGHLMMSPDMTTEVHKKKNSFKPLSCRERRLSPWRVLLQLPDVL